LQQAARSNVSTAVCFRDARGSTRLILTLDQGKTIRSRNLLQKNISTFQRTLDWRQDSRAGCSAHSSLRTSVVETKEKYREAHDSGCIPCVDLFDR
jgi:hypothetical protein